VGLRLQPKLFLWFGGLIAAIQCVTAIAVINITARDASERTRDQLDVGVAVFRADMSDREAKLLDWVHLLSRDFGFMEAVATHEEATISSVLSNHGARLHADLALLITLDGSIIDSQEGVLSSSVPHPVRALLDKADASRPAVGIVMLDSEPYQVVVMPVRAPLQIAWVCMGFLIDDSVAQSVKRKTYLEVSFVVEHADRNRQLLASTLRPQERERVRAALASSANPSFETTPFLLEGTDLLTRASKVVASQPDVADLYVLLQTSRADAFSGYRHLRASLLLVALLALAVSGAIAVLIARGITRPVQVLVEAAQRIASGDYLHPVPLSGGDELGMLADSFNEMQARVATREAEIVFHSSHDRLTGLYSRTVVHELLEQALTRTSGSSELTAMIVRIDRFKEINDKLGHSMGDRVLQAVATALTETAGPNDSVVRLGGDEFLLILEETGEQTARQIASGLIESLSQSIVARDLHVALDLSVGLAVSPAHGSRSEVLLRRADIALFHARKGNSPISIYEPGQDEKHLRRLALMSDLASAIRTGEFGLRYQPKLDIRSGEVIQVEALLRWNSITFGGVAPDEFIPLAEECGHIHAITQWVLAAAIEQCAKWHARGLHIGISINLSALDLTRDSLVEFISQSLERHGLPTSALTLEVTETALVENLSQAVRVLRALRETGITISLDDFGTGHSSLAQLKRMPVDELKIDKAFVRHLKDDNEDECIVRATIDIGHSMGLRIVAEGVEDEPSLRLLEELECDVAQGYFISRPLAAEELESWLQEYYRDHIDPKP